jgi:hypothetical protein
MSSVVAMSNPERKPAMAAPTKSLSSDKSAGALVSLASFAIDASEKGASTAFGLAADVRGELRTVVDTGIDALDNVVRGVFRIAKRATARIDELAADVSAAGERTVSGVLRGVRETTRAAGELAATAAGAVVGPERPDGRATAQA